MAEEWTSLRKTKRILEEGFPGRRRRNPPQRFDRCRISRGRRNPRKQTRRISVRMGDQRQIKYLVGAKAIACPRCYLSSILKFYHKKRRFTRAIPTRFFVAHNQVEALGKDLPKLLLDIFLARIWLRGKKNVATSGFVKHGMVNERMSV